MLRISEEQLQELVHLLPIAIYVCDASGVITHYNRPAATLWGREPQPGDPRERICGAARLFLPDGSPISHENAPLAQMLRTGTPVGYQELIIGRPDGSQVTVLVNPALLVNERGEMCGAVNCMVDITERKLAEEVLRMREAQLGYISRSVRVVLYEAEPVVPFAARWVSQSIELISGFPARRFLDDPQFWANRLHPHDHGRVFQEFQRLTTEGTLAIEYRWMHADGVYRWFLDQAVMTPYPNGQSLAVLGAWQDITDRKDTQEQLRQSLDLLRTLSHRQEAIREDERSRAAREMHDELGGRLTCLRCDLSLLIGRVSEWAQQDKLTSVRRKLESMIQLTDQTITVVQRVAKELRPHMLDELGLVAAIESHIQDFEERTGIRCQWSSPTPDLDIDRERATALFRIFQEALTNVARHAHASGVMVRVQKTRDHVMLEVEDNGDGFSAETLPGGQALGLAGMRERAALLNGECQIVGIPGKGTRVMVRIPIHGDDPDAGVADDDDEDEPHITIRQDGMGRSG